MAKSFTEIRKKIRDVVLGWFAYQTWDIEVNMCRSVVFTMEAAMEPNIESLLNSFHAKASSNTIWFLFKSNYVSAFMILQTLWMMTLQF